MGWSAFSWEEESGVSAKIFPTATWFSSLLNWVSQRIAPQAGLTSTKSILLWFSPFQLSPLLSLLRIVMLLSLPPIHTEVLFVIRTSSLLFPKSSKRSVFSALDNEFMLLTKPKRAKSLLIILAGEQIRLISIQGVWGKISIYGHIQTYSKVKMHGLKILGVWKTKNGLDQASFQIVWCQRV